MAKSKELPHVQPASAFGAFICGVGIFWTVLCYFQMCEGVRRIDRKHNLQAWAWLIPIYINIYLGTVISALNSIIEERKLSEKVPPLSNNVLLNFLFPFVPLYRMFQTYNDLVDECGE